MLGLAGLEVEILNARYARRRDADEAAYLDGSLACLAAMRTWRDRYRLALPGSGPHADAILERLRRVPEAPEWQEMVIRRTEQSF